MQVKISENKKHLLNECCNEFRNFRWVKDRYGNKSDVFIRCFVCNTNYIEKELRGDKMVDASKYVSAQLLNAETVENLKNKEVTIKGIEEREIQENKKLTVSFEEIDEELALNSSNNKKLIEKFGKETDEWVGKKIKLYTVLVNYKGNEVKGVRVE